MTQPEYPTGPQQPSGQSPYPQQPYPSQPADQQPSAQAPYAQQPPVQQGYGQEPYAQQQAYGQPPAQPPYQPANAAPQFVAPSPTPPGQGLSIAGLICGILLGPLAFIGIILSAIGFKKNKAAGAPTGLSVAGIVVSSVLFLISLAMVAAMIWGVFTIMTMCSDLGPGTHWINGTTVSCG
ncbi:MAG: hypothetical protein LBR32_00310 [Propionibacteriaceae bacterium]|jgi:hypothetical protein|nr:hypothetical protein [Propionibacteriaceae bacterium]